MNHGKLGSEAGFSMIRGEVFLRAKMLPNSKVEFADFCAKTLRLVVYDKVCRNKCLIENKIVLEGPWHLKRILKKKI